MSLLKKNKFRKKNLLVFLLSVFLISGAVLSQTETLNDKKTVKKKQVKKKYKKKERRIYIDFRDKPIGDFMKSMSKVIKKNILVDSKIKGKITIISNVGIPESKVYDFFKSVLEAKGFAIVEEKQLIKIVPIKSALAKSQKIKVGRDFIPEKEISSRRIYTQIIPIYSAEASQLSNILKRIKTKATEIQVYNSTNTIVVSGPGHEINTLLQIILELDKSVLDICEEDPNAAGCSDTEVRGNVHIYQVLHHNAEKLAQILVKLENPDSEKLISVDSSTSKKKKKNKKGKKKKKVYHKKDKNRNKNNRNKRPQKIKAVAHKATNSLIITATPSEYKEILAIIKKLDIPRKQVLVEVLIAEVSADAENSFGIDWRILSSSDKPFLQSNSGVLAGSPGLVGSDGQIDASKNTLTGFSLGFLKNGKEDILALFNANATNKNFNILSAPQVMTLDNEKATINVGADIPVLSGQRTSGGGSTEVTINSFEYRPIGIKLEFTPHINKKNFVSLELYQEVKEVEGATGSLDSNPTFTKRDVTTYVTIENEKTIVIAGLVQTKRSKNIRKVPILGDIPVLGYLFKRKSEKITKSNLLIFITPHILTDSKKQQEFRKRKKRKQVEFYRRNFEN